MRAKRVVLRRAADADIRGAVTFYRDKEARVDVWRILHAHRDIPESLRPDLEG